MKIYKSILNTLILLFIVLYPILPSYGTVNSDLILYLLAIIQISGFIFLKAERKNFITTLFLLLKDKIFISLSLLNIIMYLSTLVAQDRRIALIGSIRFSMYLFIYYSISYKLTIKNKYTVITSSFLGVAALSGIFSIIELIIFKLSNIQLSEEHRIASFLENSNNLGAYSILSLFIILLLFINEKEKKKRSIILPIILLNGYLLTHFFFEKQK